MNTYKPGDEVSDTRDWASGVVRLVSSGGWVNVEWTHTAEGFPQKHYRSWVHPKHLRFYYDFQERHGYI